MAKSLSVDWLALATTTAVAGSRQMKNNTNSNCKHGAWGTKTYRAWISMKWRCDTSRHQATKDYKERGIKVCERWRASFQNFLADMGERPSPLHSLDRINNDAGYSPENCRWATIKEQSNNRRSNRWIEFEGSRMTISQIAARVGVDRKRLTDALRKGIGILDAISYSRTPKGTRLRNFLQPPTP